MTIRVLHVTESYGAGVATAIKQYMGLPGVEHHLLARVRPESHPEETASTEHRTFVRSRGALLDQWIRHRARHFHVVHAHSSKAGLMTRLLKHPGAAIVYSPHALAVSRTGVLGAAALRVERALAPITDAYAAVSDSEGDQITSLLEPRGSVHHVPHAVSPPPEVVPVVKRERTVVAVGRLGFQKNPESVAWLSRHLAAEHGEPTRCVWVGDGDPDRRRTLESHGWEVTGWLTHTEVHRLLGTARALVHSARYEGLPYVVLEAMAMGTPVVAADIEPLRALEPVRVYDSKASLLSQLGRLLEEDDRWERLSMEAREYVTRAFSTKNQYDALRSLYQELVPL